MSESSPQSLASAINQSAPELPDAITGGTGTVPTAPGRAAPKIPSLASLIDTNASGSGDAPLAAGTSTGQQPTPPAPAAGPSSAPATATATATASPAPATAESEHEQARLRSLLIQRGFEIPEDYATDDSIADLIAAQLDANAAREQSDEYKAFIKWQQDQQTAASAATTAQSAPKTPEKPVEIPESAILSAVSGGYVHYDGEKKQWVAAHPTFTSHADAMNARDARAQQIKVALATDPEGYIQQQVEARVKALLANQTQETQAPASELKQVLEQFKQQQIQAQVSQIESWATENASRLYDATGSKTPFYLLYENIYTDLNKIDPTFDQRPLERHNEILRRVTAAEKAFRAQQPAPAPQQPAKPQTFLEGAAARRNGTNRLSEYAGPARNTVAPQIPKGGMGVPSLGGIIHQMTTLAEN